MKRLRSNGGYSLIEIMVVMAVLGVLGAMAVPMVESATSGIKLREEANAIADLVGLAKMRATSQFARARVRVNVDSGSYVIQTWDADSDDWVNEQAEVNLPFGVTFGWGDLDEAPPNVQEDDDLKFAAECLDKEQEAIDGTACIMFNSRGIPINKENSPIGGNAIYLTDGTGVRAITVTATPLVRRWWSSAANANWVRQ
jgi:prepilin-type N-terminal cleavage/methylation domain-containing protein